MLTRIGQKIYDAESLCDLERDIYEMIQDADLGEVDEHGFFKGQLIVTITHLQESNNVRKNEKPATI